ncbi:MAG: type II toxin-antitoxin system HicA family toxin [Deltaproteobacteria bacterium]|nr:type II toxin-antitoxin system HicA family toxin [Deltaproteobacteria bacterium]
MTDFPAITGARLIRALRKFGFEGIRVKGSHHFFRHQIRITTLLNF